MTTERQPVIVSAVRTPIGRFLGGLSSVSATGLGSIAIREAIRRAAVDPERIDEVIIGNVVSAGLGQAPARQAAIKAGVPATVPAMTVNKVCGSGLVAIMLAARAIRVGDGSTYVAGGMESMSQAPHLLTRARTGYRLGDGTLVDSVIHDGLWCSFEDQHMGMAAEWIADKFAISRADLDEAAYSSHQKALAAAREGLFADEIVPVQLAQPRGSVEIDADELPRPDTSVAALAKLAPAFKPDGKITAGNAPALSDGAAATVVMDWQLAQELGLSPLAKITGYSTAATAPLELFACPPLAIRKLLASTGMALSDFDLIEVNEAFSSQLVANGRDLGWNWDRVNIHGGATALGHPIGASGARLVATLISALRHRGKTRGLVSLCLGGGEAVAMSIELLV